MIRSHYCRECRKPTLGVLCIPCEVRARQTPRLARRIPQEAAVNVTAVREMLSRALGHSDHPFEPLKPETIARKLAAAPPRPVQKPATFPIEETKEEEREPASPVEDYQRRRTGGAVDVPVSDYKLLAEAETKAKQEFAELGGFDLYRNGDTFFAVPRGERRLGFAVGRYLKRNRGEWERIAIPAGTNFQRLPPRRR